MGRGGKRGAGIPIDRLPKPQRQVDKPTPIPAFTLQHHVSYELASGTRDQTYISVPTQVPTSLQSDNHESLAHLRSSSPNLISHDSGPIESDDFDIERGDDEDRELELEGLGHLSTTSIAAEEISHTDGSRKRRRTQADNPLRLWVPYIDTYLEEFLRLEGLGDSIDNHGCSGTLCKSGLEASYRCQDCHDVQIFCAACIVQNHKSLPYHRIKTWNGQFFHRTTLKELGLKVQLGHPDGSTCTAPVATFNNDFTVIDSDGVHQISLCFCGCQQAVPHTTQLLRSRLFPSTTIAPKSAATFRVLETFQLLSFTSKISAFEFYKALERRTDNTGCSLPPDRYHVFLRIIREWRHVRLLKRSGRGHSSSGVKGTTDGECAVLCPACPLPDINLPPDWKSQPESQQWLYTLFVAMDANFRLKRMNVSSQQRDPGLNHGYAFIVEETRFREYLAKYDRHINEEKSSCNNHDAIKSATMRGSEGTAANGLGTAECARHDMKRPNGVGDLQKGERYVNMDYFLGSSLKLNTPSRLVASYDIGCQWYRNMVRRFATYPANPISSGAISDIEVLVPKFHLAAHVKECQTDFSFNYVPGVGRTDGESPERGWSEINAVAMSTREMGPGSRRDTLDDHFNDRNWRKIADIAATFVRKSDEALASRKEHVEAFLEFHAALPHTSTKGWMELVQRWEKDRSSKHNPFDVPKGLLITDKEVRLRLAQEEAEAIAAGQMTMIQENMSPSILIYEGLEIEEQQRKLAIDAATLGSHSTDFQRAKILERSNHLRRKFEAWKEVQHLYVPAVSLIRSRADLEPGGSGSIAVQHLKLYLLSSLVPTVSCSSYLIEAEWLFRYSQAGMTLNDIRSHLMLRSRLYASKIKNAGGTALHTRSMALIHTVNDKIRASAKKYRAVRASMEALSTIRLDFDWQSLFKPLKDEDLVGLTFMDNLGAEGRKKLTWIWNIQVTGMETDIDKASYIALRIEWCKARARAHRWQEECLLLAEEMRRVLAYFDWRSNWWTELAKDPPMITDTNQERHDDPIALQTIHDESNHRILAGKQAYAHRQAQIQQQIRQFCESRWDTLSAKLLSMEGRDASIMVEGDYMGISS